MATMTAAAVPTDPALDPPDAPDPDPSPDADPPPDDDADPPSASAPDPASTPAAADDLEPDEAWKGRLRFQIERSMHAMVEGARNEYESRLAALAASSSPSGPGSPSTASQRAIAKADFDAAMANIMRAAQSQFDLALERERQERRWAAGGEVDAQWQAQLIAEQQAIMDAIEREKRQLQLGRPEQPRQQQQQQDHAGGGGTGRGRPRYQTIADRPPPQVLGTRPREKVAWFSGNNRSSVSSDEGSFSGSYGGPHQRVRQFSNDFGPGRPPNGRSPSRPPQPTTPVNATGRPRGASIESQQSYSSADRRRQSVGSDAGSHRSFEGPGSARRPSVGEHSSGPHPHSPHPHGPGPRPYGSDERERRTRTASNASNRSASVKPEIWLPSTSPSEPLTSRTLAQAQAAMPPSSASGPGLGAGNIRGVREHDAISERTEDSERSDPGNSESDRSGSYTDTDSEHEREHPSDGEDNGYYGSYPDNARMHQEHVQRREAESQWRAHARGLSRSQTVTQHPRYSPVTPTAGGPSMDDDDMGDGRPWRGPTRARSLARSQTMTQHPRNAPPAQSPSAAGPHGPPPPPPPPAPPTPSALSASRFQSSLSASRPRSIGASSDEPSPSSMPGTSPNPRQFYAPPPQSQRSPMPEGWGGPPATTPSPVSPFGAAEDGRSQRTISKGSMRARRSTPDFHNFSNNNPQQQQQQQQQQPGLNFNPSSNPNNGNYNGAYSNNGPYTPTGYGPQYTPTSEQHAPQWPPQGRPIVRKRSDVGFDGGAWDPSPSPSGGGRRFYGPEPPIPEDRPVSGSPGARTWGAGTRSSSLRGRTSTANMRGNQGGGGRARRKSNAQLSDSEDEDYGGIMGGILDLEINQDLEWREQQAKQKEEELKVLEEQARLKAEEANRRAEEAAKQAAEAKKREEEARRRAEEVRKKEAEMKRKEKEAKEREQAARRLEAELKRKEEEAKRRDEEARKREEEARRREEEAKQKEEEIKLKERELREREESLDRREAMALQQEEYRMMEEENRRHLEMQERERRRRQDSLGSEPRPIPAMASASAAASAPWSSSPPTSSSPTTSRASAAATPRAQQSTPAPRAPATPHPPPPPSAGDRSSTASSASNSSAWSNWTSQTSTSSRTSASGASTTTPVTPTAPPHRAHAGTPSGTRASHAHPHPSTPTPQAGNAASMSEEEWARRQEEYARKQQEAFKRAQEQEQRQREAKQNRAMSTDEVLSLFEKHDEQWAIVRSAPKLRWDTFPWPIFKRARTPEDITTNAVGAYVLSPLHPRDREKSNKDRIKDHIKRWHPDRFETQLLPKVNEEEQEKVKEGAGSVARALSDLLTRQNSSSRDWMD